MFAQFLKKGLVSKFITGVVLLSFVLTGIPIKGYAGLVNSDKLREKATDKSQRLSEMQQELIQKIIVNVNDLRDNDLGKAIAGGKGANLGELSHVPGIKVPTALALTTKAFRMHIDKGKVEIKNSFIAEKMENRLEDIKRTKGNLEKESVQEVGKVSKPSTELQELKDLITHYEEVIKLAKSSPEETKTLTLREFMNLNLEALNYNDTVALGKVGRDIRNAIESAVMPEEVEKEITEWYQKLCDEAGVPDLAVAVRSSATAEDLPDASFAGQQDTYLNIRGIKAVIAAVKSDWASLYNDQAIFYRHENNYDHGLAFLSVIIQHMVDSKSAGVVFGVNVNTGMPGFTANSSWKLGEIVVSGRISPDTIMGAYNYKTGEPIVFEQLKGTKLQKVIYKLEPGLKAKEATEVVDTTLEERDAFSLTKEQVIELAKAVKAINEHYGKYMDVEWAFDENGVLWILQARPDTVWNNKEKEHPDTVIDDASGIKEEVKKGKVAIFSGISGAPKAATGEVVIVKEKKTGTPEEIKEDLNVQLNRVKQGDILVATMTKPDMVPAMKRAGAIVTDEGGLTCHAAIVARELEIPCVVGTKNATTTLVEGETVTVDGNEGKVYREGLEIEKKVTYSRIKDFRPTKTLLGIINSSDDLAMKIWQYSKFISYYGYGLFREEFAHTTKILIHPLAGLNFDKFKKGNFKDGKEKEWIEKNVIIPYGKTIEEKIAAVGYSPILEREVKTYEDFFTHQLAQTLIKTASAQKGGQGIKERTVDFKTNEYFNQIGGPAFEPIENNPMLGYRGVYRMLDIRYREAFILELKAIKLARKFQPNIDIMLPVVRTIEEMKEAVELMAEVGLFDDEDKPQIGIMVETASIIFQSDDFYRTLAELAKKYGTKAFMSIGSNDLTQFTLGLGRDNEKMTPYFDEADPAMLLGLEIVIKKAAEYGIWSGYCGQKPSNDPKFAAFLVRWRIRSISVVKDVYVKVNQVIADEEEKLSNVPFDPVISGWSIPPNEGHPQRINSVEVDASQIIKNLRIHPWVFLKYDAVGSQFKDGVIQGELREKFGSKSVKEYVIDFIFKAIMDKIASTPKDTPIIYTTDDLEKTAYEQMLGDGEHELFDENPHLGFKGLERVVDPEYQEFFRWQLEAIKKTREVSGRKNIGIRLDSPTKLASVEKALKIMKEEGLVPGLDGFMAGMEIAKPANVLVLGKYIDLGINFLSENTDEFLSYLLALDPHSPYIRINDKAKELALENPRRIWTTIAENRKVPLIQSNREVITALDRKVNSNFDARANDKFVSSFEKSDRSKGALVIGANVLFENPCLSALRKIKDAKIGIAIAVWANDQATVEKLKILRVEDVVDIITPEGVDVALDAVRKEGISNVNITLINSLADFKAIQDKLGANKEEFLKTLDLSTAEFINSSRRGVKAINLQTPNAGQGNINNIVDIIERAIAGIVGKEHPAKYDVTLQIYSAPLVSVTKEVSEEQQKYETALEAVGISG